VSFEYAGKEALMTVDEFIQSKVLPEFRPVVEKIRQYMSELAPEAVESVSYGIPAYKMKKIFAVISPTKKDITLSFTHGFEFEDKYNLLRGKGKISRHIKFKRVENVDPEILAYYVSQALAIDSK
jgi:uncharacterized protein YdhG (YjbR/CyaY superfamily)